MRNARIRLVFLWLSQVARMVADNCLRIFVVLELARTGAHQESAWHLVTALMMVPAVFLAPLHGALGNSLPKPLVLSGSAAWCAAVTCLFGLMNGPWLACWALLMVGAALYSPTRYALLPAAAVDTHVPLTRINGWIEMGAVAGVVGGLVLGLDLHDYTLNRFEAAVVAAGALNLVGLLAALVVKFPSDVRRPEPAGQAVAGFFRDCRRIWRKPEARGCLLGLASLRGLLTGMTGVLAAAALNGTFALKALLPVGGWVMGGVALGSWLAGRQRHPRRVLGLVPIGATGLTLGLILLALGVFPSPAMCVILGLMGGLINVPLSATYQADLPADARGNGMAIRNFTDYVLIASVSGTLAGLAHLNILSVTGQFWLVAALAAIASAVCWRALIREFVEFLIEIIIWPFYKVRGHGPGLDGIPQQGPLLVIANHCAWLDPVFVATILPRSLIPMMTSVFYDLPGMRWLMVHVFHTIRVQAATFRREIPELKEAIAALDRGESLLIFPEGAMRRQPDKYLRQFGQGVWHILRERPNTPVVVCWIEGNWGCYFSYCNGPPTKNKPLDFWRHVDVAVHPPQILTTEVLENQKTTRAFLMQSCLEARAILGLEVPALEFGQEVADEPGTA